jgi:transcriptional regulator with XRE-family HTH domain
MSGRLPPSTAEIAAKHARLEQIASNLEYFMAEKGLNQSTLARRSGWGEYTNPRTGRVSANRRAKISSIIARKHLPTSQTVIMLAKALDVTPKQLTGPRPNAAFKNLQITTAPIADHPDKIMLQIPISRGMAEQIMGLLI